MGFKLATLTQEEAKTYLADLFRDGWIVMNITNKGTYYDMTKGKWRAHVDISNRNKEERVVIWADDRMQINVPYPYSMENLEEMKHWCIYCKKETETIKHIGFAGRACEKCYAELLPVIEHPGWYD